MQRHEIYKDDPNNEACINCGSKWGTQTVPVEDKNGNTRLKVICLECERFVKWQALPITKDRALEFRLHFGKHSGIAFGEIAKSDPSYLKWILEQSTFKDNIKQMAKLALEAQT